MPFDGFISYSHAADGRLAPAVQRGLHRLARPWHRRRALWIFRDQTGLSVTPGLWSSIQTALDGSQYFVLLASPEAARSPWVNKEIEHWVATKSPQRILPVLTDGEWCWDAATGDFTDDSTAVPAALRGAFGEEPLYLDLRWAREDLHLSLQHARFRDAIAQLAAPMHGVSKDELESEDVRQHRRARRLWSTAMATLVALALVASLTGILAVRNAGRADASAVEARRQQANAQAQQGQAQAAAAETRRQEQLAVEQRALADQAADDAARQQENAGRQQANARRHEEDARRQKEDARRAEEDARRQRENARRYEEDARRQQEDARRQKEDARRAEEDARQQHENARRHERDARRQQELADQAEARARRQEKIAQEHQKRAEQATEERRRQEKIAREQEQLAREAAGEARRQREEAALQRRIRSSQLLMERARALIDYDPKKAVMLGVAAEHLHSDAQTRDQLSHLVTSTHYAGDLAGVADVVTAANGVLVTADTGGTVSLWNISQPARPVRITRVPTVGSAAKTLTASPDGRTVAVLDGGPAAVLWDVSDPARPARVAELADAAGIVTVAISPDGRTVATGNRDKNTTLWDVRAAPAPAVLSTLPAAHSLTFGPAGRTAATSGATAIAWNLADLTRPVQVAVLSSALSTPLPDGAVVYNPKHPVVLVEDKSGYLKPWDLRDPARPTSGVEIDAATGDSALTRAEWSADGWTLAVSDSSGTTRLRTLTMGSQAWTTGMQGRVADLLGRDGPIRSAALSRDGELLITAGERHNGTLWKVRGAFARNAVAAFIRPAPADVIGVAFGPDGRTVMAADSPGTAVSWDLSDLAKPAEGAPQQLNTGWIQLMDLSPDGRTLAVADIEGTVTLLDMTRPGEPARLSTITDTADVYAITFGPGGQTLAVGRADGTTTLFGLADRTRPAPISEVTGRGILTSITFSADGRMMAVAAGYNLVLWDMADPSAPVRHTELAMERPVLAVAFSSDETTMAVSAGYDGTTMLWDIVDPARPHRLSTLRGSENGTSWLGFSPDGRVLATAGISEARLWEVTDRRTPLRMTTLSHSSLRTRDLAFSPDGHTLASAGSRSVTLWDYSVPKELRDDPVGHACAITGRGLTKEEWTRYVPELEHQRTC